MRWTLFSLMALSFVLRALIPQGFMPSAHNPFVLKICPDGFPAQLLQPAAEKLASHHMHGTQGSRDHSANHAPAAPAHQHASASSEHCLFGSSASGVGPLAHIPAALGTIASDAPVAPRAPVLFFASRHFRLAQPRAPPFLA